MRYSSVAVSVLAAVVVAACSAGENPSAARSATYEAAVTEAGARLESYVAVIKSGDVAALADFYAPEITVWEPGRKSNAAELVKVFEDFARTNALDSLRVTSTERVAYDSPTTVYEFGNFAETFHAVDGKTPAETRKGNYAIRWVRGDDSKWRIQQFLITDAPPDSVKVAPAVAAVAPADGPAMDAATVEAQVKQAMSDAVGRVNADDENGLAKTWAEDIQLYEPGVQFMSKATVAPAIHGFMEANKISIALVNDKAFVHDNGHVAYLLGEYQQTVTPKDGKSKPMMFHNKFMARWKRAADGSWLWDRMIVVPLPKDSAK